MEPRPSNRPQRIRLRPARPGDAALLHHWRREPSVRRHQPLGLVSVDRLEAELAAQRHRDLLEGRGDKFQWIIEFEQRPAGWMTLVVTNWEHGLAELGYALSTPFQRRGITPRALELLLDHLFGSTVLQRVEARCAVDNVGSIKVLEATGFRREGRLRAYFALRGRRVDNYLYAVLRDDARRPPRPR